MKKLILLPFLVFGQFLAHAQKPAKKAQQVITLNLMPAGSVHLPKIKKDKNNDTKQQLMEELDLASNKNLSVTGQVIETVSAEKKPDVASNNSDKKNEEPATQGKKSAIIYTISPL